MDIIKQLFGRVVQGTAPDMVKIVRDGMFNHPAYTTIVGGQCRLIETGMEPVEAWDRSRRALIQFLEDHNCKIGDPAFAWDNLGGREIVEEYEIDCW